MSDPRLALDEAVAVLERICDSVTDPDLRKELLRVVVLGARGELAPAHVSPLLQHRALWLRRMAFHLLLPRVQPADRSLQPDPQAEQPDP